MVQITHELLKELGIDIPSLDPEPEETIPHGSQYVSQAYNHLLDILDAQNKWLSKAKNKASEDAEIQKDLRDYFSGMLGEFVARYLAYTSHPQFAEIHKKRGKKILRPIKT